MQDAADTFFTILVEKSNVDLFCILNECKTLSGLMINNTITGLEDREY